MDHKSLSTVVYIFSTLVVKQKSCKVVHTVNMVAYRIHHFTTPCGMKQNLQLPVSIIMKNNTTCYHRNKLK